MLLAMFLVVVKFDWFLFVVLVKKGINQFNSVFLVTYGHLLLLLLPLLLLLGPRFRLPSLEEGLDDGLLPDRSCCDC